MYIPIFKSINSLLLANKTGFKSETEVFHIHQIQIRNGVDIQQGKSHRTDFYGLVFIENGNGKICINNNCYEFESNILIFTSPGQTITATINNVSNGYLIFFMPEFLNILQPETIEKLFLFFKLNSIDVLRVKDDNGPFKTQFRNMNTEYYYKDLEYMNIIRSYMLVLLNLINRHHLKTTTNVYNHTNKNYFLTSAFESLVLQNMLERKTIKYLAEKLSVSPKHLIKIIKSTTGKTPSEFSTQIFMQEAKKLLLYSNLTVNEVAYSLNFKDLSYFNKVFKKFFNVSPPTFKKRGKKVP